MSGFNMREMGEIFNRAAQPGRCRHLDVTPVESGGEVVASLCLTCDAQLPPHYSPPPHLVPSGYRVEVDGESRVFPTVEEVEAFARSQGWDEVTYCPYWHGFAVD